MNAEVIEGVALVIPAFNPDQTLVELVDALLASGFVRIIIVNDGSSDPTIFANLAMDSAVIVIEHESNMGKGAALKSGFERAISEYGDSLETIVTVDADGQHTPRDVLKLASSAKTSPGELILGVRDFGSAVPFRSRLGNLVTRYVLKWINGIDLRDTQTGLRAIPVELAQSSLKIQADRYQFELECLIDARNFEVPIRETPIETVYIEGNASSHFRPLLDSMRIYFVFGRFLLNSIASFLVDILAFMLFYSISGSVYGSTYLARILSATSNFVVNKYLVFRSPERQVVHYEAIGYAALAIVVATLSAYFVSMIGENSSLDIVFAKILVDISLFFLSFAVQKVLLFRRSSPQ